jgi:lipoprotein-anchoring transpeptidase ErfK/SrfK
MRIAVALAATIGAGVGRAGPGSVGGFVSYGCIRMLNDDITILYRGFRSARS